MQVLGSIEMVSNQLGKTCDLFSYPEGQCKDFNKEVVDYLKDIGIEFAPTAMEGVNDIELTDPFELKRCMVGFEGRSFFDYIKI